MDFFLNALKSWQHISDLSGFYDFFFLHMQGLIYFLKQKFNLKKKIYIYIHNYFISLNFFIILIILELLSFYNTYSHINTFVKIFVF